MDIAADKEGKIKLILINYFSLINNYDFIKILRITLRTNMTMRGTLQERKLTRMKISPKVCGYQSKSCGKSL